MFIDEVEVTFEAGHGGPGKVSFITYVYKGGPDGGNGGKGGDLYIRVIDDLTLLKQFLTKKEIKAENGAPGEGNQKTGKNGNDLYISLPLGTTLKIHNSDEVIELNKAGEEILLCKGGIGGKGNYQLRSSKNTTPLVAQPGLPGEKKSVFINLSLIADFGLIGLPNAGKSSILNALTNANVKIGNYSFTTLEPNLAVISDPYKTKKILADIPGLIEGASEGKGLGIKFLKHIEKVSTLLHCISSESNDPLKDYQTVRNELSKFSPGLLEKKEIVLLTKSDLLEDKDLASKLKALQNLKEKVIPISVIDEKSLVKLKDQLLNL